MGHLPFNLITLQLVAPTANMTKAEYKDAYGIDLDDVNIKAFKLVLFGGEKYAIDQIKEVEDGIEIYFNGRIMSITDIVQVSDEVYSVANAKPIYCHPLYFEYASARFMMLIFNNRAEAYTYNEAKQVITDLANSKAYILCNGYKQIDAVVYSVIYIGNSADENRMYLASSSNFTYQPLATVFADTLVVFDDGVNKIN